MFGRRQSAPSPAASNRQSFSRRLSHAVGATSKREPFTIEEAKSEAAADIALRIGNKDPSLPCLGDHRKYTPLHIASALGKEDVAKKIINYDNRTVNAVAKMGLTPLILAAGSRHWKIVHLLIAAGAELTAEDGSGRTAYDIAIEEKAPETILAVLTPTRKRMSRISQATPFSSIVVSDDMTINLRGDV